MFALTKLHKSKIKKWWKVRVYSDIVIGATKLNCQANLNTLLRKETNPQYILHLVLIHQEVKEKTANKVFV